jgi:hypothetical protein
MLVTSLYTTSNLAVDTKEGSGGVSLRPTARKLALEGCEIYLSCEMGHGSAGVGRGENVLSHRLSSLVPVA